MAQVPYIQYKDMNEFSIMQPVQHGQAAAENQPSADPDDDPQRPVARRPGGPGVETSG